MSLIEQIDMATDGGAKISNSTKCYQLTKAFSGQTYAFVLGDALSMLKNDPKYPDFDETCGSDMHMTKYHKDRKPRQEPYKKRDYDGKSKKRDNGAKTEERAYQLASKQKKKRVEYETSEADTSESEGSVRSTKGQAGDYLASALKKPAYKKARIMVAVPAVEDTGECVMLTAAEAEAVYDGMGVDDAIDVDMESVDVSKGTDEGEEISILGMDARQGNREACREYLEMNIDCVSRQKTLNIVKNLMRRDKADTATFRRRMGGMMRRAVLTADTPVNYPVR
ncbi:hypothetical protein B484DRAFT_406611 [Ochromonadaceae sp. CCMP2298]|nr:hypothetical protein B484DRAFT_406611 [Ochromonadaceae sp. CCMP2298]